MHNKPCISGTYDCGNQNVLIVYLKKVLVCLCVQDLCMLGLTVLPAVQWTVWNDDLCSSGKQKMAASSMEVGLVWPSQL
jgi:hypothetical protein